jgi:hypothetical protein
VSGVRIRLRACQSSMPSFEKLGRKTIQETGSKRSGLRGVYAEQARQKPDLQRPIMFLMFGLLFKFAWVFEVLLFPGKSQVLGIRNQIDPAPSPLPLQYSNSNFNFNSCSCSCSCSLDWCVGPPGLSTQRIRIPGSLPPGGGCASPSGLNPGHCEQPPRLIPDQCGQSPRLILANATALQA